jgi:hypothetical protein
MLDQFKYDQSMDIFWLRFIIEGRKTSANGLPPASILALEEGALHASLLAARSSPIDE